MEATQEEDLVESGLGRLRDLLGPGWEIVPLGFGVPDPPNLPSSDAMDLIFTVKDPGDTGSGPVLVEAKHDLTPRYVTSHLVPRVELIKRVQPGAAVLIVAPWLSPRTRDLLESLGYGYVDLTGNIQFRLARPGVVIRVQGDQRAPTPARSYARQLRGDKAGVLVRALVDVAPPYRATPLAKATRISLPYVTRLLDTMESQALLTRQDKQIVDVDWRGLLQERAAQSELLQITSPLGMTAQRGIPDVLAAMRDLLKMNPSQRLAITGPYAAAAVAPLTVGGQLMIYVEDTEPQALRRNQRHLRLLPTRPGGTPDVLLLTAPTTVVFADRRWVDGLPHVALSQLVLDSLSGSGRMPAEGQAVLDRMARTIDEWRLGDLTEWSRDQ